MLPNAIRFMVIGKILLKKEEGDHSVFMGVILFAFSSTVISPRNSMTSKYSRILAFVRPCFNIRRAKVFLYIMGSLKDARKRLISWSLSDRVKAPSRFTIFFFSVNLLLLIPKALILNKHCVCIYNYNYISVLCVCVCCGFVWFFVFSFGYLFVRLWWLVSLTHTYTLTPTHNHKYNYTPHVKLK